MLTYRLVTQARTGAVEKHGREHHQQDREVHHGALVKQQGSDDGDILQPGDGDAGHGDDLLQVGAGAEIHAVDEGRQRRRKDVDRHAVHCMVGAQCHRGECVDHVDQQTGQRAAQQAQPVGAGDVAGQEAHQRADGGQALQADVDHAGPLSIQLGQGDQQQRDGQANGGQKQTGDPIHYLSPAFLFPENSRLFQDSNSGSFVRAIPATENTITSA